MIIIAFGSIVVMMIIRHSRTDTVLLQSVAYLMQAGSKEVLLKNLPAFPDNLNWLPQSDTFWVGFAARASPLTKSRFLRSKLLRGIISRLPDAILERLAPKVGGGIGFDGAGNIIKVVADAKGTFVHSTPAGVLVNGGNTLLLSNLHNNYIAAVNLAAAAV
jgi:hypothetical protein